LESAEGRILGTGFYNPHSLIAFRFFQRGAEFQGAQFESEVRARLSAALVLRQRALADYINSGELGRNSFRLVFGESDGLPGLIVDLFESDNGKPVGVVQCHAAGADAFISVLWSWMSSELGAQALVVRNDVEVREREGAAIFTETLGVLPSRTFAREGGVEFEASLLRGQKTGYFYDLRHHRRHFAAALRGHRGVVLDAFSYIGSWGLQVLKQNPNLELLAADTSRAALDILEANAAANGLKNRVRTVECDLMKDDGRVFEKRSFAGVVCDPPALTQSAKQLEAGRRAHVDVFSRALSAAAAHGPVALASCSFHLGIEGFLECVSDASFKAQRSYLMTELGTQDVDHPVLAALPESRYLKCALGVVTT